MLKKKRRKIKAGESPGIKAYEDINLLCCNSFLDKELSFNPKYVSNMDEMVKKLEIIENDVKDINVIKEIMLDWQNGKLSDRHALVLILEIIAVPAYTHYQNSNHRIK